MSVQDVYNNFYSRFSSVREYLAPVLKNSKFKETGCITPEEFVAAGDFLVYKCPTWSWEGGDPSKRRDYLPADKQFLITRNVPCLRRAKQMEYTDDKETEIKDEETDNNDDDGWMYTHSDRVYKTIDEIAHNIIDSDDIPELPPIGTLSIEDNRTQAEKDEDLELNPDNIPDIDDIPDMEDSLVEEEEDPAAITASNTKPSPDLASVSEESKILQVRTYDVFISYDKYYQTPRLWLFGYDEQRRPLMSKQVFEDVSSDYVQKTVTIEAHPHLNMSLASIHPCKHADVMKKIIERMAQSAQDPDNDLRVDQYLIIFLKFMSSVMPTIDYDHTISA
ncbi:autophagocytosis protein [Umbelopsis sp. PMI_123]|nr:autophagocytosis protein [Umbelopsis sp. PMI_123]